MVSDIRVLRLAIGRTIYCVNSIVVVSLLIHIPVTQMGKND